MPAPDTTPAHYSPAAERIFLKFARPRNLSLEGLILEEINEHRRTIRELAPAWGCSVSLLSQICAQLGVRLDRFTRATITPRGGKALR